MKENNNELNKNEAEQVAGGDGPGSVGDINNQLAELRRLLENERNAYAYALGRMDESLDAAKTAQLAYTNILDLLHRLSEKEKEKKEAMADLLADITDIASVL